MLCTTHGEHEIFSFRWKSLRRWILKPSPVPYDPPFPAGPGNPLNRQNIIIAPSLEYTPRFCERQWVWGSFRKPPCWRITKTNDGSLAIHLLLYVWVLLYTFPWVTGKFAGRPHFRQHRNFAAYRLVTLGEFYKIFFLQTLNFSRWLGWERGKPNNGGRRIVRR